MAEEQMFLLIGQVGYVDKTKLGQRDLGQYEQDFIDGTFNIKAYQTCFLYFTNFRILAMTVPQERTTASISILPFVSVPIFTERVDSEYYLSLPYDDIRRYRILRSRSYKGDWASFCFDTDSYYCSLAPTDHRSLNPLQNRNMLNKIESMYMRMGIRPRETGNRYFFNLSFSMFIKDILDNVFSKEVPVERKEKIKKVEKDPEVEDDLLLECPVCGENSKYGNGFCEHCNTKF